jgi:hypothetical protein
MLLSEVQGKNFFKTIPIYKNRYILEPESPNFRKHLLARALTKDFQAEMKKITCFHFFVDVGFATVQGRGVMAPFSLRKGAGTSMGRGLGEFFSASTGYRSLPEIK